MSLINNLISERLKKNNQSSKMSALAKQSASGNLTSFSGIFSISELNENEKELLTHILQDYATGEEDIEDDFAALASITSEVKAINNQAAILHGERIKKAQQILIRYRDGAFTSWLIAAYGNRQTPYNFLQYFEFYEKLPKSLRPQIESMPRQAVYTLASREAPIEKKLSFVEAYRGETKAELLIKIRELFPLEEDDQRRQNFGEGTIQQLKKLSSLLQKKNVSITRSQKAVIYDLLDNLREIVSDCKS
jgi:hypothetical protein